MTIANSRKAALAKREKYYNGKACGECGEVRRYAKGGGSSICMNMHSKV